MNGGAMKYVLSIDRGTTAIKAALYDYNANEIAVELQRQGMDTPAPGWCEQDMNQMWENTAAAIRRLLSRGFDASDIKCIGFSGQGNGVFLSDENGRPVRPGIVSMDSRAQKEADEFNRNHILKERPWIGSTEMGSANPLAIMLWLKRNEPDVYAKTWRIHFSKDWIRYCLTGEFYTDFTDASGACLMDLRSGEYSEELCRACGVPEVYRMLPPLKQSVQICGEVTASAAEQTGLKEGTPVVAGAHDVAACSLGCGGADPGHLSIIFGTMGLNLLTEEKPDLKNGVNLFHILPGRYLSYTCLKSAGGVLDRVVEALFTKEKEELGKRFFAAADEQMNQCEPTQILFYPYLFGSNAEQIPCTLTGVEAWHSKYHVLLGIYQGLVYEFARMTEEIRRNNRIRDIYLVGGGAKSGVFPQLFADVLEQPVKISSIEESGSRGAAICALSGLNHESAISGDIIRNVPVKRVYTPREQYRDKFREYYRLYRRVASALEQVYQ